MGMTHTLFLSMLAASPAFAQDMPQPIAGTRLDVTATGTVERTPDMAVVGAGVVTHANTAAGAMQANARAMAATVAALRKAGVAAPDLQTSALRLAPQYRYGENQPPALTGYEASNRVQARIRGVDRVGPILDALVSAGANQIDGPTLSVEKPEAALDEARTRAIAAARARADIYARAVGLRVRRIVRIDEQGQDGPPVVRPMMMMARAKADATPVEAGEQALAVTVAVTFELG